MIDSVMFRFEGVAFDLGLLEKVQARSDGRGWWGRLGSLVVSYSCRGLSVRGSLSRYLVGCNIAPLTRPHVAEALRKLERESGIDLAAGRVFGLEVGSTFAMDEPPSDYLASWLLYPRRKRTTFGNGETVIFENVARALSGYDKAREVGKNRKNGDLDGRKILRIEERIRARVDSYFGQSVKPWDLADADFYGRAVKAWAASYFRVEKKKEIVTMPNISGTKDLEKLLAIVGLSEYGLDRAEAMIARGRARGAIDKKSAQRMRAKIRAIAKDASYSDVSALTEELDAKVRDAERFPR